MKKVLVYGISDSFGGVEAFLFNIISNTDMRQVRFDILTYHPYIQYQEAYEQMGVGIHTITSKHENMWKNKTEMQCFFQQHASEYEVVWCNLAELINIDILKLAKKYGIKRRIIHSHSIASTRGKLLTTLHQINRKLIGKIATDFWACSVPAGRWFYNETIMQSGKFQVIKNAIDTSKYFYNEEVRAEIRRQYGLEDAFVVGHVGRFSIGEKNTLFLLEIFREIRNLNPKAKLMVVGDGADRHLVEQKIEELDIGADTLLLGYRDDVAQLMSSMDVFVLPSHMEGLGIVLIEAQSCGLPCFTSAYVVPQEVALTELVHYVPLDDGAKKWAEIINEVSLEERTSRGEAVKHAGYDTKLEAKRVENILVG